MAKALEGVKVLDFTRMAAGPYCTMLLAELGAQVVKIEQPGSGDPFRTTPPINRGESYSFVMLNRGKKSVTLDLASQRGQELAKELVKKVDIVAENFTPGVMDRLGLGYDELNKINYRLIYASTSGFGHTGPDTSQPAFDPIIQARGGLMSVTGFPDSRPTKAGIGVADMLGGIWTVAAVLAALHYRERTGKGQFIDISMQDCMWAITALEHLSTYSLTGKAPPRIGNGQPWSCPFNSYPAKDGEVIIALVGGGWQELLRIMGREELVGSDRYATISKRVKYRAEVDGIVSDWTRTKTVKEIVAEVSGAGLPCSPVSTFDEVANDPQLLSRGMIVEVEQSMAGKLKVPGSVFKLSVTPGDIKLPAPLLGQHNAEVYSDLLGYSEQEITKLAAERII